MKSYAKMLREFFLNNTECGTWVSAGTDLVPETALHIISRHKIFSLDRIKQKKKLIKNIAKDK